MRIFRIYCSILIGVGFTAFVVLTLSVSWMIGIGLLMPGIAVNWVATAFKLPETYGAVLVGDALLYSGIAAIPVYLVTTRTTAARKTLFRSAALLTILTTVLVLGGWSAATYLDRHGDGPCQNSVDAEMDSPDKAVSAVVRFQDCGATDAGSTSLTLKFNHTWFGTEDTIFATKYETPFEMRWKNNSELVVYCPACKAEEVRFQKAKSRTVKIEYKFGVAGLDY